MNVIEGADLRGSYQASFDVVVVGSGPAGAAVALELSGSGARVAIVEEGPLVRRSELPEDGFSAMARLYRDLGANLTRGRAPMPIVQGRAVGGTSLVNGAISWRLPREVWDEWVSEDPPLSQALPWEELERTAKTVEQELCIGPTEEAVAGPKNLLLAKGAQALGLEHRPIRRNVRGCRGLGRCLQGCPEGNKTSMDVTYLPLACERGARIYSSVRVRRVCEERGSATGIEALSSGGARVQLAASQAVVLAASAVQTPALLLASGIRHGPTGEGFQCHPGVSMAGRFPQPVRAWEGATQGHEVIGLRGEGIKFEALGYDLAILAARLKGVGRELSREISSLDRWLNWGAAIRAAARGTVRPAGAKASVRFALLPEDMRKVRRGVRVLGEMMLAAGAEYVAPGVFGWHERVADRAVMARFEEEGPLDPRAYSMAVTHMFGTCRLGSDPNRSVLRPDFRHHAVDRLFVADSSAFPSNTGVNPQTAIITLARTCARRILGVRG
ncbi:MAG: GMC family oxidoreductase [Myxococcales bacterium]|nr:GMC family oxidoreductase [Myxococcales bacterium]